MNEFKQVKCEIDERLEVLRKNVFFCLNSYDYHHRNNEMEILQKFLDMLKDSHAAFKLFLDTFQEFQNTLTEAQQKCNEVDVLLLDSGLGSYKRDKCPAEDVRNNENKVNFSDSKEDSKENQLHCRLKKEDYD